MVASRRGLTWFTLRREAVNAPSETAEKIPGADATPFAQHLARSEAPAAVNDKHASHRAMTCLLSCFPEPRAPPKRPLIHCCIPRI